MNMYLSTESEQLSSVYSYITNDSQYKKLKFIPRHSFTNTYDHSIRVALLASKIAKKIGANEKKTIRAGLLHDFCLLDYHEKLEGENYIFLHPKDAIINSKKFSLSEEEQKAILSHMFPLGKIPTNKIGWCLTLSDKIVAFYEKLYCVSYFYKYYILRQKKVLIHS